MMPQGPACACPPAAREMSDEMQALAFFAGANSIFYGEKLLTTGNPDMQKDQELFRRLGIHAEPYQQDERHAQVNLAAEEHARRRAT